MYRVYHILVYTAKENRIVKHSLIMLIFNLSFLIIIE